MAFRHTSYFHLQQQYTLLYNAMRPLVLSWSVLGLKHYTAGAGVGVLVKSVFVAPQRHKKLKRLGNVTVHTAAETGIIQSQRVIA